MFLEIFLADFRFFKIYYIKDRRGALCPHEYSKKNGPVKSLPMFRLKSGANWSKEAPERVGGVARWALQARSLPPLGGFDVLTWRSVLITTKSRYLKKSLRS